MAQSSAASALILSPAQYADAPVYDLLKAAARGLAGVDQRLIKAILDRGASATADLARFAAEDHDNDLVILEEELVAMFRYLRAPEGVPYLIDIVRDEPDATPDDVVEALAAIGEPAVEPLLKLYEELDQEDNDVPFLLASLRVRHPRILDILIDRLAYDPVDAAMSLGVYGDPAAIKDLEKFAADLDPGDADVRGEIQHAIEQLSTAPAPADDEPTEFDIWSNYPEEALPLFDLMDQQTRLAFLESPEPSYRMGAVAEIARRELNSELKRLLVRIATEDPGMEVRAAAWEGLGAEAVEDHELRDRMLAVLRNESASPVERTGALIALALGGSGDIDPWIEAFYENAATRASALEAMWRSFDMRYAPRFVAHLADNDTNVRREALWGVGHLRLQSELGRLRDYFNDDQVREDALFNYALAWPGEVSRARARAMLRKIEQAAGGLSGGEAQIVQAAIDQRLALSGMKPYFASTEEEQDQEEELDTAVQAARNDACPCGSGKKFKKCCGR